MTLLGDIGFPGPWDDFIVAVAAIVTALSTIVLSIRVLARVRVFRFIGRALVGDPFTNWLHRTVSESPLADQVRSYAENDDRMHREQRAFNGVVDRRLAKLEKVGVDLTNGQEQFRQVVGDAVDRQTHMAEGMTQGLATQAGQVNVVESIRDEIREHEERENMHLDDKVEEVKRVVQGESS